jgi:uncharacterized membrane protein YbhN (UPF0104 family)
LAVLRRLAGSLWIRLLVSAALLAAVATQIDFHALRDGLTGASWGWFVAAVAVVFVTFVVGALRWHVFLDAAGVGAGRREAVRAYLIGAFTTNFLPTQIGGDVTRAWVASGQGTRIRSLTTVVVDRATALACLIVVGWIAVASNLRAVPGQLVAALAAASAAYALACAGAVLLLRWRRLRRLLPGRLAPAAREARDALAACLAGPVLWRTFAVGLAFQALVYLAVWLVVRSIALAVPFAVVGSVLAPVMILSTAPVSIGGFGVREGSYVLLLGYAGVSATEATLFSLLGAAAFALASLPGALAIVVGRRSAASSQSA